MPKWTDAPAQGARDWRFDWTGEIEDLPQEVLDEIDAEMDAHMRGQAPSACEFDFPRLFD